MDHLVSTRQPPISEILKALGVTCQQCDINPATSVNHKIPLASGGTHEAKNLEFVCDSCHKKYHGTDRAKKAWR
jgi:5-methylcytosine-specific restriction endonuclease McrA